MTDVYSICIYTNAITLFYDGSLLPFTDTIAEPGKLDVLHTTIWPNTSMLAVWCRNDSSEDLAGIIVFSSIFNTMPNTTKCTSQTPLDQSWVDLNYDDTAWQPATLLSDAPNSTFIPSTLIPQFTDSGWITLNQLEPLENLFCRIRQ